MTPSRLTSPLIPADAPSPPDNPVINTAGSSPGVPHSAESSAESSANIAAVASDIADSINSVVVGRSDLVTLTLVALLAGGHLLVEDVPGVGKTTLAQALARSIDCRVGRIQFTPDLLPSDLTGVSIYRQHTGDFEFRPGPVFNHIVIADEINRASPKTQSALLECMEEGTVTADGTSYRLPQPFLVVATQNPVELEGTYPLPEAQRDRFMLRLDMGYPDSAGELDMLNRMEGQSPLDQLAPVATGLMIQDLCQDIRQVYAAEPLKRYIVDIVSATRHEPQIALGASPRASLQLLKAAKALAAIRGRDHVIPDDVQYLARPLLAHRLIMAGRAGTDQAGRIVEAIVARTPVIPPHQGA